MPWRRLEPAGVVDALRVGCVTGDTKDEVAAVQALEYLREQLLTGRYITVQDHTGRTFIGTPDEAIECMMDGA